MKCTEQEVLSVNCESVPWPMISSTLLLKNAKARFLYNRSLGVNILV